MGKGRFEAFSDGVIAIIITIMVLELKVPHGASVDALLPLLPVFLSYILSFVYIGFTKCEKTVDNFSFAYKLSIAKKFD